MKKLVTANEVREFLRTGKNKLHVDDNTIVTPAAKDFAREHSIEITNEPEVIEMIKEVEIPCEKSFTEARMDMDMIYKIVREVLAESGAIKPVDDFVSFYRSDRS